LLSVYLASYHWLMVTRLVQSDLLSGEQTLSATVSDNEARPVASLGESLGRSLRHELGDFLQKVYATVAILETRLPSEWRTERDVLTRLRERAEDCRRLLDEIQDFLCPVTLDRQSVDAAEVASQLVKDAQKQYPHLQLSTHAERPTWVAADPVRIGQVGEILLINACQAARHEVTFETIRDPLSGNVEWCIQDDGPGIPAEVDSRLFRPFFSTRPGHVGLGLALAQKLVLLHGGHISLANQAGGGCRCQVRLPASPGKVSTLLDGETAT
jgi:two-component system sensor histidine kinase HydH